jgi:signal transduction histidine kinase
MVPPASRPARELARLLGTVWPLLATIVCLLGLGFVSMRILGRARASVACESLWSKGQKEAVLALLEYADSRDPADYRRFRSSLGVILGDRAARLALEATPPDRARAVRGFLDGGNDPDDVDGLIMLFQRFGHVGFVARPIAVWRRADEHVLRLADVAAAMHAHLEAGRPDGPDLAALRARVRAIDAELTALTVQVATFIGEAARTTQLIVCLLMLVAAGVLVPVGLVIVRRLLAAGERLRVEGARLQERMRSHELMAGQKLLLECQAEASTDGILAADQHGQVVTRNRALDGLWALPASARSVAAIRAHIATQLTMPARFVDELVRLGASGSGRAALQLGLRDGRTVLWRDAPMADRYGRSHGRVSYFCDITALVAAEAAGKRAAEDRARLEEQRLEIARQQGRAQVADNVLHAVGNVLNSVNVSANLSIDGVRALNLDGIAKSGRLLVGEDALGARTPAAVAKVGGYLGQLAEQLGRGRDAVVEELRALGGHVEQLRAIVSMQEALAQPLVVVDELAAVALTHEAIGRLAPSFREHDIAVVCAEAPAAEERRLRSERHRVLDVLVQLLSNARDAVVARSDGAPRRIEVRIVDHGDDGISWEVSDNGVGIAPEHVGQLFGLGFTTKADGHGFGLHGSALAARALNGSLSGKSDGPNRGATFTLRLRDLSLPS